jgi:ArsR family transcriptional regulator
MDVTTFEALADERRLSIVRLLARGELCVCEVSAALGISDALASHHLKILRESGLVETRRSGRWLHCRLDPSIVRDVAAELSALAERAIEAGDRDGDCCSRPIPATETADA